MYKKQETYFRPRVHQSVGVGVQQMSRGYCIYFFIFFNSFKREHCIFFFKWQECNEALSVYFMLSVSGEFFCFFFSSLSLFSQLTNHNGERVGLILH